MIFKFFDLNLLQIGKVLYMFKIIYNHKTSMEVMILYRRHKSSDTWHFCKNCSGWPTSNYDERHAKPTTGELCNECKSKQKNNICKK